MGNCLVLYKSKPKAIKDSNLKKGPLRRKGSSVSLNSKIGQQNLKKRLSTSGENGGSSFEYSKQDDLPIESESEELTRRGKVKEMYFFRDIKKIMYIGRGKTEFYRFELILLNGKKSVTFALYRLKEQVKNFVQRIALKLHLFRTMKNSASSSLLSNENLMNSERDFKKFATAANRSFELGSEGVEKLDKNSLSESLAETDYDSLISSESKLSEDFNCKCTLTPPKGFNENSFNPEEYTNYNFWYGDEDMKILNPSLFIHKKYAVDWKGGRTFIETMLLKFAILFFLFWNYSLLIIHYLLQHEKYTNKSSISPEKKIIKPAMVFSFRRENVDIQELCKFLLAFCKKKQRKRLPLDLNILTIAFNSAKFRKTWFESEDIVVLFNATVFNQIIYFPTFTWFWELNLNEFEEKNTFFQVDTARGARIKFVASRHDIEILVYTENIKATSALLAFLHVFQAACKSWSSFRAYQYLLDQPMQFLCGCGEKNDSPKLSNSLQPSKDIIEKTIYKQFIELSSTEYDYEYPVPEDTYIKPRVLSPDAKRSVWEDSGRLEGFIKLRGAKYLQDRKKVPNEISAMELVQMTWRINEETYEEIGLNPDGFLAKYHIGQPNRPFLFVINFHIPGYANYGTFWAKRRGVDYERFNKLFYEYITCNNPDFRRSRFKIVPKVVDGPLLARSSVGNKPAILGNKLDTKFSYYPEKNYAELTIDVGSSSVAKYLLSIVKACAEKLVIDFPFLLEAQTVEELPEVLLGACRMYFPYMYRS
eukprot:snap_masked-scaffold_1-processed-gene-7.10-mRNA-1 protein AED:0.42 eAED:0.42 QI:0/0/0/0.5/1/1/2/0/761